MTRCEHQDSLLQGQREMVGSLEVDCDEMSPVGPCEVERVYDANGSMQSLGGVEASGSLVRTPTSNVIVPEVIALECGVECMSGASVLEGVQNVSVMLCMSACEELVHGPIQKGDGYSEPKGPLVSISGAGPFHGTSRTGPVSHLASGPRERVFVAGIRRGIAPHGIQQGLVDG